MNIGVQISLKKLCLVLLDKHPEEGLQKHVVTLF